VGGRSLGIFLFCRRIIALNLYFSVSRKKEKNTGYHKKEIDVRMSKSVLKRTDVDNLITNLRGELGSVIEAWTLELIK
jgi:hypothetical protein